MGINGLYVNLRGREKNGTVEPRDRRALMDEIAAKLLATVDPATGQPALTKVYAREDVYHDTGSIEIGPDLQMGYAKGTRGSGKGALGDIEKEVIRDNLDDWTGDHIMDHESVPGVLLASRKLAKPAPSLKSLASALLAELGVEGGFPRGETSGSRGDGRGALRRDRDVRKGIDQDRQGSAGQGEEVRRHRRLLDARGVHHPRAREGAGEARGRRLRGRDPQAAEGARLHLVMAALNRFFTAIFDLLLRPFEGLSPLWSLVPLGVVFTVFALYVFKWTSNQKALDRVKQRIHAGIFEIRLFNDDLRSIARSQFDVMGQVVKQLALTLVPLLWMLIPFAIVIPQLQFRYGYSGLEPGESTLLEVTMRAESGGAGDEKAARRQAREAGAAPGGTGRRRSADRGPVGPARERDGLAPRRP